MQYHVYFRVDVCHTFKGNIKDNVRKTQICCPPPCPPCPQFHLQLVLMGAGCMHARLCRALLVGCAPSRAEGAMKWSKLGGEETVYKSAHGNIGGTGLITHSLKYGQKHVSVFQDCRGTEPPRQRRVSNSWMACAQVSEYYVQRLKTIYHLNQIRRKLYYIIFCMSCKRVKGI